MKKLELVFILLLNLSHFSFAQLTERQFEETKKFNQKYAQTIDNQDTLINGNILTYSHNIEFEYLHITDSSGIIHLIDVRERKNNPGYIKLAEDKEDTVIFEYRGNGSDNPPIYFSISKSNGIRKWLNPQTSLK